ncbi:MAG: SEL1-like repeat protein, partial [Pseudomonadales bacterium]|nr:SEL1-like repeat protein [Pseudomonadales bacterium]
DVPAQAFLGRLYLNGLGMEERDLISAYMWFKIANSNGDEEAANVIATLRGYMKPDEIHTAEQLAASWASKQR